MNTTKPIVASKSGETATTESVSGVLKGATARRRANLKVVQSVLLIWLDANIDEENDADCRNTINQLRRVVNNINTFTNSDQCIQFIDRININENKACMIISGSLGQHIVPQV